MAWFKKARKPIAAPDKDQPRPRRAVGQVSGLRRDHLHEGSRQEPQRLRQVRPPLPPRRPSSGCCRSSTASTGSSTTPDLRSNDPLNFTDTKPYRDRLRSQQPAPACPMPSSSASAASTASRPSSPRWSTASSAAAWASWWARRSSAASRPRWRGALPLIIVSCSGGARMMEGALSLMQMAKISAALARLDRARPALHLGPHRSDDRRRHGQLRDAGRPQHRRAARRSSASPARASSSRPSGRSCPTAFSAASSCSSAACSTWSSIGAS